MARCGCSDTCNCVITAADPITVSGTGSQGNPYVIGAFYSGDADNIAGPGSDGGIYVPDGGGGGGGGGGATVASLPATDLVGAWRAGAAMGPENTLNAARISHNGGASLLHIDLRTGAETAGGFFAMADPDFARVTTMSGNADNPNIHAAFYEYAGFSDGNNTSWWSGNVPSGTGLYGDPATLLVAQVPLFVDFLERFARRVVLMPHIQRFGTEGELTNLGSMIIPFITAYGAQQSVIVLADTLDDLAPAVAANIAAAINIRDSDGIVDYPPAAVLAAGVDWVVMFPGADDAEVNPYIAAGLQVLFSNYTRHVQRARATSLGARGVLSADPVYTAKTFTPFVNRSSNYANNAFRYGTLGEMADSGNFSLNSRGAPLSGGYWSLPATIGGGGAVDYTILTGSYVLRPELGHNLSSWRLQNTIQWDTAPNTNGGNFGVFFSCPDDGAIYIDGSGVISDTANGYRVRWLYSGTVELHKCVNGVFSLLYSGTWRASSAVVGTAYSVSFQVNPTTIALYTTIGQTLITTVSDSQFRGPYTHMMTASATRNFTGRISPRDLITPGL